GKEFIDAVKDIGAEQIMNIHKEIQKQIFDNDKMQKQSISLSIVLTADRIATDYLFQDGEYIDLEEAKKVLIDRNDLSDNERCYQYILGEVVVNSAKFDPFSPTAEKWGIIEDGFAIIYSNVFDSMCKRGGFSKKAFLTWADKKDLLQTEKGRLNKLKKIGGAPARCVFLKMDDGIERDEMGFSDGSEEEKIPFETP
ncbi:hypothetical protein ACFQ5H_32325, partial [Robinsoniella peoriensis]